MTKTLLVSVGTGQGVENGIVASLRSHNPAHVVFFTTEKGCQTVEKVKELLKALPEHEVVLTSDENDIEECFSVAEKAIASIRERFPAAEFFVDFTSGTKAMSAAVAMAGIDECRGLTYVWSRNRDPLTGRSLTGGSRVTTLAPNDIRWRQMRARVAHLFNTFQFKACAEIVLEVRAKIHDPYIRRELDFLEILIAAYSEWDMFDHKRALVLFGRLPREAPLPWTMDCSGNKAFLNCAFGRGVEQGETGRARPRIEHLVDLLANAERRASEGKYDDAVARLYRAFEMIAQIRLWEKGVDPSAVTPEQLPQGWKRDARARTVAVGQRDAYKLLAAMHSDELAAAILDDKRLKNDLKARNSSILAHGIEPVSGETFASLRDRLHAYALGAVPDLSETLPLAHFAKLSAERVVEEVGSAPSIAIGEFEKQPFDA